MRVKALTLVFVVGAPRLAGGNLGKFFRIPWAIGMSFCLLSCVFLSG